VSIRKNTTDHQLRRKINRFLMAKNDSGRALGFFVEVLPTCLSVISAANQTTNDLNGKRDYVDGSKNVPQADDVVSSTDDAAELNLLGSNSG